MKLILAIINKDDCMAVTSALTRENFIVTQLSTKGGFLLTGNTTLLIGADEENVDRAEEIIQNFSHARTTQPSADNSLGKGLSDGGIAPEVLVGGATVFVLSVDKMTKY